MFRRTPAPDVIGRAPVRRQEHAPDRGRSTTMGILDGRPFDPASFQQASEAAEPGWLGLALPPAGIAPGMSPGISPGTSPGISPGLAGAGRSLASASAGPPPAAGLHGAADNPFTALLGGIAAPLAPAAAPLA